MSRVIVNPDASESMLRALKKLHIEPIPVPLCPSLPRSLAGHPDLQIFVCGEKIFCRQKLPKGFLNILDSLGELTVCRAEPRTPYPLDVPFNIACTENAAFCRTDSAAPEILAFLKQSGRIVCHVSQGYSKCSAAIAGQRRIITGDAGMHRAAEAADTESLLIESGHIDLHGYKYGFIGGASGFWNGTVFFAGSLEGHPDRERIESFIASGGAGVECLTNEKLTDIGSLLFLNDVK